MAHEYEMISHLFVAANMLIIDDEEAAAATGSGVIARSCACSGVRARGSGSGVDERGSSCIS